MTEQIVWRSFETSKPVSFVGTDFAVAGSMSKEWNEAEHERDEHGRFEGGGSDSSSGHELTDKVIELSKDGVGRDAKVEWVPIETIDRMKEYDRADPTQAEISPEDARQNIDELKESIKAKGFEEPLILEYSPRDRHAYLGEGNHRLAAAKELGLTHVPVTAFKNYGELKGHDGAVQVQGIEPDVSGYIPEQLKPSQIGLDTLGTTKKALDIIWKAEDFGRLELMWKEWNEDDHPRGPDGRFGSGGGGDDNKQSDGQGVAGREMSDDHLVNRSSQAELEKTTHTTGDRNYKVGYTDGRTIMFRAESWRHAKAMGQQYASRFLPGVKYASNEAAPPGTPIVGTDPPPGYVPSGAAPTPTTEEERQTEGDTRLQASPELRAEYEAAQARIDASMAKGEALIAQARVSGTTWGELSRLEAQAEVHFDQAMNETRAFGDRTVKEIEAAFEATKPEPPTDDINHVRLAAQREYDKVLAETGAAQIYDRMMRNFSTDRAAVIAAPIVEALTAAGASEAFVGMVGRSTGKIEDLTDGTLRGTLFEYGGESLKFSNEYNPSDNQRSTYLELGDGTRLNIRDIFAGHEEALADYGLGLSNAYGSLVGPSPQMAFRQAVGGRIVTGTGAPTGDVGESREAFARNLNQEDLAALREASAACVKVHDEGQAKENAAYQRKKDYDASVVKAYSDAQWGIIGSLRPLGGELTSNVTVKGWGSTKEGRANAAAMSASLIGQAQSCFPTEWIQQANDWRNGQRPFDVTFKTTGYGGGVHYDGGRIVVKGVKPGTENLRSAGSTLLHEYTHGMQERLDQLSRLEAAFLRDRCPQDRKVRVGGGGTGDPDKFRNKYSGRSDYGGKFSEVATTGMQGMLTTPLSTNYDSNLHGDRDFQNFMTGVLLVSDRKKP